MIRDTNSELYDLAALAYEVEGSIPLWLENKLLAEGLDVSRIYNNSEEEDDNE